MTAEEEADDALSSRDASGLAQGRPRVTDDRNDAPPGFDIEALRLRRLAEREALSAVNKTSAESRQRVELDQAGIGRLSRCSSRRWP